MRHQRQRTPHPATSARAARARGRLWMRRLRPARPPPPLKRHPLPLLQHLHPRLPPHQRRRWRHARCGVPGRSGATRRRHAREAPAAPARPRRRLQPQSSAAAPACTSHASVSKSDSMTATHATLSLCAPSAALRRRAGTPRPTPGAPGAAGSGRCVSCTSRERRKVGLVFVCVRRTTTTRLLRAAPPCPAARARSLLAAARSACACCSAHTHASSGHAGCKATTTGGSCAYGAFGRACRTCAGRCPRAPPRGSAPPPSARAASTPNHPPADPALRSRRRVTHTHTRTRRMSAALTHATRAAAARTHGVVAQRCASAKHAHTARASARERTESKSGSPSTGSALGRMSSSSSSSSSS